MKNIAVFTGTRAEYGLLYWILKGISVSEANLQLFVGGMHLSPEFGCTFQQIEKDGFCINERLEFLLSSDSPVGITKSLGLATISAAEAIERNKPDILVLLGDRYESLALAQAALIAQVPVAHIHGGELTQALIDDAIRHAITKMSHIHFTSNVAYQNRIIKMGEQPQFVYNVGAPGLDNLRKLTLLSCDELSESIKIDLSGGFFLVTYHPVTLEEKGAISALENLLSAIDNYPEFKVIITYPNADTFGRNLIEILKSYQKRNSDRVYLTPSLGQINYLSALKHTRVVLGNSSSGIIEAPTCKVASVNIGDRQKGRISAESVIHCQSSYSEITTAITQALSAEHQMLCRSVINPYGDGYSSEKIVKELLRCDYKQLKHKVFYDAH
ncbi:UDP-N-acetylglucosamine 2-epimerase [Thalassotalea piscium]|uniref:UDP-hydrolyzing UDP-N-acetyl-D-glucosamine 2-epimerase n=1 Tax=Thalassotalea piscium TaxID=1230533 RepID=A0A7X0TV31_9GAMM|nr:UDP-N-acetylglucosamine 2-epimerase [Thalassotalea piscium]MBB6544710.1 UDP-hydrolyzing UDP-N-acetyl-D-glucosamine 2-epimerase [Thalassotalea piscium]